jgi:hypothetical protein
MAVALSGHKVKKGQDMHQKHDLSMDTMIASTREWIPLYTRFRTGGMNKSNKYYTGRQGERERKEVVGSNGPGGAVHRRGPFLAHELLIPDLDSAGAAAKSEGSVSGTQDGR